MLKLSEIKENYSPKLQVFSRGILREYIQYKILEVIYSSKFASKLVFMGGTALRIVYDNQRFSEDLDFDNFSLTVDDFENLTNLIENSLENEGYEIEIRNVYKGAFHCYIKIPKVLQLEGLSDISNEKITIRIDTTPQNYDYKKGLFLIDKFGVYQNISVVPIELLMAQKFAAILGRKRAKGRDYFDLSYLFGLGVEPDMLYIEKKLGFSNLSELRIAVLDHLKNVNLEDMVKDVEKFLFNPSHTDRIRNFPQMIEKL